MSVPSILVCGLKLTHDGGIAVVEVADDSSRLVGAIECEKVDEGARHAPLSDLDQVAPMLADLGCTPDDIDRFVVDGWGVDAVRYGLPVQAAGREKRVRTAPYRDSDDKTPPLHRYHPEGELVIGGQSRGYTSLRHVTGHVAAAYLSSPAAMDGKPSYVLVWDGGLPPELFHISPHQARVEHVSSLINISGSLYSGFSSTIDPFCPGTGWSIKRIEAHHLSVPGKVMAYAGLGEVDQEALTFMSGALLDAEREDDPVASFTSAVHWWPGFGERNGASILANFERSVGALLVDRLRTAINGDFRDTADLAFTGGCALNIKWNSVIRRSGVAARMWVPPFPNDSGAALGAAAADALAVGSFGPLHWSVYQGPPLVPSPTPPGWSARPCSPQELGRLLADLDLPVVVLTGRAEMGPRALGHRSILASPRTIAMRDRLNEIKLREPYRPVAPLCLAERSAEVFEPGGDDPYMLFDHRVRPEWTDRIPAVVHVDGTARLQTVAAADEPIIHGIISGFFASTGIPVLCNTSANRPGRGFFPSVTAAAEWDGVAHIWSEGVLFARGSTEGL